MQENAEDEEMSTESKYGLRMCVIAVLAMIPPVIWTFIRQGMESGAAVNMWQIQFYESLVVVLSYAILIGGFIVSILFGCVDASRTRVA